MFETYHKEIPGSRTVTAVEELTQTALNQGFRIFDLLGITPMSMVMNRADIGELEKLWGRGDDSPLSLDQWSDSGLFFLPAMQVRFDQYGLESYPERDIEFLVDNTVPRGILLILAVPHWQASPEQASMVKFPPRDAR